MQPGFGAFKSPPVCSPMPKKCCCSCCREPLLHGALLVEPPRWSLPSLRSTAGSSPSHRGCGVLQLALSVQCRLDFPTRE